MGQVQVFLSHSSADNAAAETMVTALYGAGVDVWFDKHNLGAVQLLDEISRQLSARPVFVVLLSKAAFASEWVRRECKWAFNLFTRDPSRIILPVVVSSIDPNAFNEMLYLEDFRRIEGPDHQPCATEEMVAQTLRLLALTPEDSMPISVGPQLAESADDLIAQGNALATQQRWAEALPFFRRATECYPNRAEAWGKLGWLLFKSERFEEALTAFDPALALNNKQAWVWGNKGFTLSELGRYEEALMAYERAFTLNPDYTSAWVSKGFALNRLDRYVEALSACERAITLDPNFVAAWNNKGFALNRLERYEEALAACERALALDPLNAIACFNKGNALYGLKRYEEALSAYDKGFDRNDHRDWNAHARVYRALGRVAEAEAAERRAMELGG